MPKCSVSLLPALPTFFNSDGEISKCNRCNFKRRCSTNQSVCKANGKKCIKCLKFNHFPKSKNCSKTRKERFNAKLKENNPIDSCQTLRSFLKSINHDLKSGMIPYEVLKLKSTCAKHKIEEPKLLISTSLCQRDIMFYIMLLEQKLELTKRVSNLCWESKTFLLFYLLTLLQEQLIE